MANPRLLLATALLLATLAPSSAQTPAPIKVGVLNDMSGPYADLSGPGSVIAAQMAADDFMAEPGAPPVKILSADHQNKPDLGAAIARAWVDQDGVAAIVDVPNSAVGLAVNQVMREKDRTFLASSTATSDLTGPQCAETTVQWTFDTWSQSNATIRAIAANSDQPLKWFFIGADYALGAALIRDATPVIAATGGTLLGDVRAPLGTIDLSPYLLQAQSSGADIIVTANAGADVVNTIKQAAEFGIARHGGQRLAGLLVFLTDIQALGLQTAQGLFLTEAFYWDLNDATRAWSRRFAARAAGRMPTMNQAGVYSATLAYLRAARATPTLSGRAIVGQMKAAPIQDPLFGPVTIRKDGRALHAMYLFRVKAPAASKAPNDLYDLIATIPPAQAFRPLEAGHCPLVTRADASPPE